MNNYEPSQAPNSEEWLALAEAERIYLIETFHNDSGEVIPEGAETLHAVIHAAVENQIALSVEPLPERSQILLCG